MNYIKVYNQLIEHAKLNPLKNYNEEHHIIPHAEGGSDDKSNKVKLTARQHYIAHLLLAKIYDDYAMHSALTYMQCKSKSQQRDFKFNSRLYEKMRIAFAQKVRDAVNTGKIGMKGKRHTEETRKKISESCKGRRLSLETRKKISNTLKGKLFFNNGKVNIVAKECPEGFVRGRLVHKPRI